MSTYIRTYVSTYVRTYMYVPPYLRMTFYVRTDVPKYLRIYVVSDRLGNRAYNDNWFEPAKADLSFQCNVQQVYKYTDI